MATALPARPHRRAIGRGLDQIEVHALLVVLEQHSEYYRARLSPQWSGQLQRLQRQTPVLTHYNLDPAIFTKLLQAMYFAW